MMHGTTNIKFIVHSHRTVQTKMTATSSSCAEQQFNSV